MELSTYFRINERNTGQFERTLIIAEKGATFPISKAARRRSATRTSCMPRSSNWSRSTMPRSNIRRCRTGIRASRRQGRHLQFRDQARRLPRRELEDLLDAGRNRLGDHLEISELHPARRQSRGEFYSIAISNDHQQVDTGTKMIHLGKNTTSRIISKGIAAGVSQQHLSRPGFGASQGDRRAQFHQLRLAADRRQMRRAHGALYRGARIRRRSSSRGDDVEDLRRPAVLLRAARPRRGRSGGLVVNGFVKDVLQQLPMEFAVEAQKLIAISLEGVGWLVADPMRRSGHLNDAPRCGRDSRRAWATSGRVERR